MRTRTIAYVWISTIGIGCSSLSSGPGAQTGGGVGGQCGVDFGASAEAQKLEAFVVAADAFGSSARDLEGSLAETCKTMGRELGISDAEMQGSGVPAAKAACDPVAAKLRSELTDLRAAAHLTIQVAATPPRCEVSVDAYAKCAAECDATVDPGTVQLQCEGGEIVGKCSGECQGSCAAEVSGKCEGQCEGTCDGGCGGTCQGACDGTCATKGADGQCAGKCNGTCRGTCSASCKGNCSGQCAVSGQASCSGECRGGCSVAFEEPRCTGTVRPPEISAECKASCDARLNAQASCQPGEVAVIIKGNVDSNIEERVNHVKAALEGGWANLQVTGIKLARLRDSGEALVATAKEVPGAVGSLGIKAVGCATEAAAAVPSAFASVGVSVEVSVSVSASASASAG